MSPNKAPWTTDYLLLGSVVVARAAVCASCRQPATGALIVQRLSAGRPAFDSSSDYCEQCLPAARERLHGELHRRLYGALPPAPRRDERGERGESGEKGAA